MLLAAWIAFLLVMLFLLGSAVGSFLNVCLVRLPRGQSLLRPGSHCGHCQKAILLRDNLPLLSFWLLRGRCRACGAPFSIRYFWVELLTGLAFVLIFHLEIGWNIHHFPSWKWYGSGYEYILVGRMPPQPWACFAIHALLGCFLILTTLISREHRHIPPSIVSTGLLTGLFAAVLCPWPWPEQAAEAIGSPSPGTIAYERVEKPYAGGPRVGAMPADKPWWRGEVTPRAGVYSWPVWGPLPDWLPPDRWQLVLATGLAGTLAGAALTGLVRLAFNVGVGAAALGWGEIVVLTIAGAFLGWQPILVAGLLTLVPGLIAASRQFVGKRQPISYCLWLALVLPPVWLAWYWIGPLVQGLFFEAPRLLLFVIGCGSCLLAFTAVLRLTVARIAASPRMELGETPSEGSPPEQEEKTK